MTSSTDRFMNRQRKPVTPRVDEIGAVTASKTTGETPVLATETPQTPTPDTALKTLQQELDSLPQIESFHLRFESSLKAEIQAAAENAGVTPETLLQAAWIVLQREGLDEAIAEAKEHYARRSKAAELKNSITRLKRTLKNFGLG
ncbi:hypothetical protein H6G00_01345 [Leptolyngbya sp. FACHB-541]|uniref:hypothetical protein n=1 Tax=Leptolyngbya sp. FACHB-541 TaxID=2692810 RepID=UPI001685EB42|nr:hypothetical protein [Leptolyngbya sp. FACHB-541]MBD1995275.1 hypothetical protein [Leptolyngbya sp. FACHB-541]